MSTQQPKAKSDDGPAKKRRARKKRNIAARKAEEVKRKKALDAKYRYVPWQERERKPAIEVFHGFSQIVLNIICSYLVQDAKGRWRNYRIEDAYDARDRSIREQKAEMAAQSKSRKSSRYYMSEAKPETKKKDNYYKGPFFITMMLMPLRALMCTCRFFRDAGMDFLSQADLTQYFKPKWVIPGQKYLPASDCHEIAKEIANMDKAIQNITSTIKLVQKGTTEGDLESLNARLARLQKDRSLYADSLELINKKLRAKIHEIEKSITISKHKMVKKERKAKQHERELNMAKEIALDIIYKKVDEAARRFLLKHCGKFLPGANSNDNYDPYFDEPRSRKNAPGKKEINRNHTKRRNKQVYMFAIIDPHSAVYGGSDLTWADILFKKRPAPNRTRWGDILSGKSEMMTFRETLRLKIAETLFGNKKYLVSFYVRHVHMPDNQLGFQLEV